MPEWGKIIPFPGARRQALLRGREEGTTADVAWDADLDAIGRRLAHIREALDAPVADAEQLRLDLTVLVRVEAPAMLQELRARRETDRRAR